MTGTTDCDIAIVGAGFAGLILARVLRRRGLAVVVLDRARHPRFALGESSTPLAGVMLERLAGTLSGEGSIPGDGALPDLHHLATWGRFRRAFPELRVGLKRGFSFYSHGDADGYRNSAENDARLLVGASPDDELGDVQHHRGDLDAALAHRAVAEGVVLHEGVELVGAERSDGGATLAAQGQQGKVQVRARWAVDASGGGGVLARMFGAEAMGTGLPGGFVAAHVRGLPTLSALAPTQHFEAAPYPEERAAVHHLFADGWMWELRFDHGLSSVGLVLDRGPSLEALEGGHPTSDVIQVALRDAPELRRSLAASRLEVGWISASRGSVRLDRAAGESWLALPNTFAFADPMFSTGLAWSLLGVERVARVVAGELAPEEYQRRLVLEADCIAGLIRAARATRGCFRAFAATTWAYFATVSWAEVGSRLGLGVGELDRDVGFLGVGDEVAELVWQGQRERIAEDASMWWAGLETEARRLELGGFEPSAVLRYRTILARLLAARDLIGITDPTRGNLHPADLELLVRRSSLLGLSTTEMRALLPRLRGL